MLLRRAMSVPGIIDSALSPAETSGENNDVEPVFPSVHETPEGPRELAQLVRARVRVRRRKTSWPSRSFCAIRSHLRPGGGATRDHDAGE